MPEVITIEHKILKKNADIALENRARFDAAGVFVVGLVSARPAPARRPAGADAGGACGGRAPCAVITGDLQTDNDARRLAAGACPPSRSTPGAPVTWTRAWSRTPCARSTWPASAAVHRERRQPGLPGAFDLGETQDRGAATDRGRGQAAQVPRHVPRAGGVLTKIDLLPYVPFDLDQAVAFTHQ